MSFYYFHILCGTDLIVDEDGMLLRDFPAARAELMASAKDLVFANATAGRSSDDVSIEMMNEDGELIDSLSIRRCLH